MTKHIELLCVKLLKIYVHRVDSTVKREYSSCKYLVSIFSLLNLDSLVLLSFVQ